MSKKQTEQAVEDQDTNYDPGEALSETAPEIEQEPTNVLTPIIPPVVANEMGGVAWCDIYGKKKDADGLLHLVKISLTNRSSNAIEALRGLMEALAVAKEEYHMTPYQPEFTRPDLPVKQVAPLTPPAPVPGQPVTPPPPPGAALPAPAPVQAPTTGASQLGGGVFAITKIKVTPGLEGKILVELFETNHKWPDLKMNASAEKLATLFGQGWTAAHFAGAAEYTVNLRVAWLPSTKLNSNGQPYKNVASISPA